MRQGIVPRSAGDLLLFGCSNRQSALPRPLEGGQLGRFQAPRDGTFTTIDDPSGTNGTYAWGINAAGDIVGNYYDSKYTHGFLWRKGKFTTLDDPKAGHGPPGPWGPQGTVPIRINRWGDITGPYIDGNNVVHGFVLSGGVYHHFDEPNAGSAPGQGTDPNEVDERGNLVGIYWDRNTVFHGFLKRGSAYTTIDDPYGGPGAGLGTEAEDIDPRGAIVGWYADDNNELHGYILRDGRFSMLDDPKAPRQPPGPFGPNGTQVFGFNPQGGLVGAYNDANTVDHGFLLCDGIYTTFDDPQGSYGPGHVGNLLYSVNTGGEAVGTYWDSNNVAHGYLYRPKSSRDRGHRNNCEEGGGSLEVMP